MALSGFTETNIPPVYQFAQFTGDFEQFKDDVAAMDAVRGGSVQVVEDESNPGQALVIIRSNLVLGPIEQGSWLGNTERENWTWLPDSEMQGTVNGGYTPAS